MAIMLKGIRVMTLMSAGLVAFAFVSLRQQPKVNMLDRVVSGFVLRDVTPSLILERLAKTRNLRIGLETIPEPGPKIDVIVERGTIRNILDQIIKGDPRYEWREVDGGINVYPKANRSELLEIVVPRFRVAEVNSAQAISTIFNVPTVRRELERKGLSRRDFGSLPAKSYSSLPRFSVSLRNVTVRTILNGIMRASGNNYWVFFRYGDHNKLLSISMS